jgi:hypothetical protein
VHGDLHGIPSVFSSGTGGIGAGILPGASLAGMPL